MISTSQIGRYAAIPAQVLVNGLFTILGKETRFHGQQLVVSDDVDEFTRGRNEANAETVLYLLYLMVAVWTAFAAPAIMAWFPPGVALACLAGGLVSGALAIVSLIWFDAEAIRKTDAVRV